MKLCSSCSKHFLALALIFSVSMYDVSTAWAQGTPPAGETSSSMSGTRKHLATIIFAGLGGAILGLSTLSFYGRPQDHLENIALGFAVGVIGGTVVTTYSLVTSPDEFYGTQVGSITGNSLHAATWIHDHSRRGAIDMQASAWQIQPIKMTWSF